jgi:diacylglycerol kinase family enzyme
MAQDGYGGRRAVTGREAMTQATVSERFERFPAIPRQAPAKPRMLLVVNPMATTVSARLKNLVVYALRGRYEVVAIETEAPNHATRLTGDAASARSQDRPDLVVAFGGDGTLNEVANGLAGSDVPMSMLPGGCTNVMCRMLGVPVDVVDATEHLLRLADEVPVRRLDLGSVNGRYFMFSSGVGLDADVTRWVDERPKAKSRGGVATFTYAALSTYVRDYRSAPPTLAVECEGERYEGLSALAQNSDPYTYFNGKPLHVCEDIGLENGFLSMMVMRRARLLDTPGVVRRLFASGSYLATHPQAISLTRVNEARVRPARPGATVPVEVDGDYIGQHTEVTYTAHPGALSVVA